MRTTVTLDDDTLAAVHRLMRDREISFKRALNDAIREGAQHRPTPPRFVTRTTELGVPAVSLDRALQVAADLEDEELLRRQRRGA